MALCRHQNPSGWPLRLPVPDAIVSNLDPVWPVSSASVKEQLVAIIANKTLSSLAEALFSQVTAQRLEKVSKFELIERLPP